MFCFTCLNVTAEPNKDELASLTCPGCTNVTRRRLNDNTPVRSSFSSNTTTKFSSQKAVAATSELSLDNIRKLFEQSLDRKLEPSSSTMVSLRAALREDIKSDLKALVAIEVKSAVEELKVDFTSTTDFICAEQKDMQKELKQKDTVIKTMETEQLRMKHEIDKLNSRISTMEKISRSNNLELQAIPENRDENVKSLFKRLCECLNVTVPESEIKACRRVAKMKADSDRPRNILVTLSTSDLRDKVISAAVRFNKSHPDEKEKLNVSHLGFQKTGRNDRIYLSEHLSPDQKQLHASARKFAKENNYKYVWVRYGQINLRKDDTSKVFHVKNEESLCKLIQPTVSTNVPK